MAIEILGRLINLAPIVDGLGLSMRNAAGVLFVCTGADTNTITVADTFAGTYATPGNIITRVYTNTSLGGTAAWVKVSQAAANTVVVSGATTAAFWIDAASLPDGKNYIKCTSSAAGLVTAIFGDLRAQRTPQNLPILGA